MNFKWIFCGWITIEETGISGKKMVKLFVRTHLMAFPFSRNVKILCLIKVKSIYNKSPERNFSRKLWLCLCCTVLYGMVFEARSRRLSELIVLISQHKVVDVKYRGVSQYVTHILMRYFICVTPFFV